MLRLEWTLDGSDRPARTLSSATFRFTLFSRVLTITRQHDYFEKLAAVGLGPAAPVAIPGAKPTKLQIP